MPVFLPSPVRPALANRRSRCRLPRHLRAISARRPCRPEKIADVNEEELAAGDERSILSKAPPGVAEAEFIGLDGALSGALAGRRARDRPDGKLQRVERSLARIGDGGSR